MSAPMAAQTYEEGLKLRQRLFAKLREIGYHPVPIVDGEKNPLTLKWPELARANDPSLTLETGQSGIGLECTGLRIVDIDIDDPDLAARVTALTLKMLGPAPRRFRDNTARVAFLYKAATGEPRKRVVKRDSQKDSPKVEILGAGCQVFAFGKHPSGADLRWSGLGYARGIIPRDDLPSVTELQITEYLTEVGVMIGATTSPKPPTSCSSATSGDLKACDINALAEIVSQIPNDARYDDRNAWVTFAHAIAAAFADDLCLGRDLWLKFCNRRKIPQVEGAPEKVWDTLGTTHEVGVDYLLHQAVNAGVDVGAYSLVVAQETFKAGANMPPQPSQATWPANFRMTAGGLLFDPPGEAGTTAIKISDKFEVVAESRDAGSENWGMLLRWTDRDNQPHEWALPRSLLHAEGGAIASQLEALGLRCSPGRTPQGLLKTALGGVSITRRLTCVQRLGWHQMPAGPVFVMAGGETFGPAGESLVLQRETAPTSSDTFCQSGRLLDWQQAVAQYAVGNSRVALFIAAALAGPLLDIMSEPSGGFHLSGDSRSGKSTAAYAAGSVWGRPSSDGQIRTWRATANGLEGVAAESCDTVLILDEIGQADGKQVGEIVYGIANGSGKTRATRDGEARRRKTWRVLLLSTGEVDLATKLASAGQAVMSGQEVRLIHLPADAGAGKGVFENLHGFDGGGNFADHLRTAACTSYGTAGRAFVAELTKRRNDNPAVLLQRINALREVFLEANVPPGANGQVRSIASRFALVAIAGELASEWCVLPWVAGESTRAAAACFGAFLKARGSVDAGEDTMAVTQVKAFLELHGESRFTRLTLDHEGKDTVIPTQPRVINRAGFYREIDFDTVDDDGTPVREKRVEYLIQSEAWKTEVCKGMDPKRVAITLAARNFLQPDEDKAHNSVRVRIPGFGRLRVYAVNSSILAA